MLTSYLYNISFSYGADCIYKADFITHIKVKQIFPFVNCVYLPSIY